MSLKMDQSIPNERGVYFKKNDSFLTFKSKVKFNKNLRSFQARNHQFFKVKNTQLQPQNTWFSKKVMFLRNQI